jgi:uncharacterized membrane protein
MKPFLLLIVVFILTLAGTVLIGGSAGYALSGRIAMSAMLVFTAIGHFAFPKGMALMMPDFMPVKLQMVYFTGLVEIAGAIGLLFSSVQILAGWLLILFFVLVLPVNINAALKHVDYQKPGEKGPGPAYLWFRVPLQIFFIAWVWFFAIHLAY